MGEGDAGVPKPSTNPKTGPALSTAAKTGGRPATAVTSGPAVTGRRPLVSKEAREARAAEKAAQRPFYARLPRGVKIGLLVAVAVALLVPASIWGYRAYQRAKNPDEYAVREQLYSYRFDSDEGHFANLDAMGPKAIDVAIKLLVDRSPAEMPGSHSTTTAGELAEMYLMHCAIRAKIDPPAKAVQAKVAGLPTLDGAQWSELQQVWTAWVQEAQTKGALPK